MSTQQILLLDIVYCVLEQLYLPDDARTLGSCAVVCKAWLPIARRRLFADMDLRLAQDVNGEEPFANPSPRWTWWYGYLVPKHAEFSLARRLNILTFSELSFITPLILSTTLSAFPNARSLRIVDARIPVPERASALPAISSSLGSLELVYVYIPSTDFRNLLSLCPNLRNISLDSCRLRFPAGNTPLAIPDPSHRLAPSSLTIVRCGKYNEFLFDFFGRSDAVRSLREFTFGFLTPGGWWGNNRWHWGVGKLSHLESLAWVDAPTLPSQIPDSERPTWMKLKARIKAFLAELGPLMPNLRSLHTYSMYPYPVESQWEHYLAFINMMPQSLRHFEMYLNGFALTLPYEFRAALDRFVDLQSVRIVFPEWVVRNYLPQGFEAYAEELYAGMPELSARLKVARAKDPFPQQYSEDESCMPNGSYP